MKSRIISVDVFRGITIAAMILVNTPGSWSHIFSPLSHSKWNGYTPTDLIFPFFLFIMGCSISFVYKNRRHGDTQVYKKIIFRTLKLIVLGLFLNAFRPFLLHAELVFSPVELIFIFIVVLATLLSVIYLLYKKTLNSYMEYFLLILLIVYTVLPYFYLELPAVRIPGVLQRIGLVFMATAVIFLNTGWKTRIGIILFILLGYWFWTGFITLPGGLTPTIDRAENNWVIYIDQIMLGNHMWKPDYDPEGLLSSIPCVATTLIGGLTGQLIISKQSRHKKFRYLLFIGVLLLTTGSLWGDIFPINKALWTSSYVLVSAGWACVVLSILFYIIEIKGKVRFGRAFVCFGANAITIYFLSEFIAKNLGLIRFKVGSQVFSVSAWLYQTLYVYPFIPSKISSLLYALTFVALFYFVARLLYKKSIFIKV